MPTILRQGPYRFFFYSADGNERMHVHVERDDKVAKFWLDSVQIQSNHGFLPPEISRIAKIIKEHQKEMVEKWNAYFGK